MKTAYKLARAAYKALPFKPIIMRAVRTVWKPSERVYRHLHFEGPIALDLPNGKRMRINHFGNQVENDLFWAGFGKGWEKESLFVWLWLVQEADVVLDIGANTGVYALSAQASRPAAKVFAFEPVLRIYRKLAINVALNGYPIEARKIAVSDHDGVVSLYDPGGEHAYSASLNAQMLDNTASATEIKARQLDSLCDELAMPRIDLMKIDVEMHEPEVITGAQKRIAADKPAMLIEILNAEIGNRLAEQLDGYVFFEIGKGIHRTASPGTYADRNCLVLHREDPRVAQLGDGIDFVTLRGWVVC